MVQDSNAKSNSAQEDCLKWSRYQSDHLSLPGFAVSPTTFVAGLLSNLADMIATIAPNQAADYRNRSSFMIKETIRRLWEPTKGRFSSLLDPEGYLTKEVLYYTDLAFPALYCGELMDPEYTWLTLADHSLWLPPDKSSPYLRIRVGGMRPTLFGNNIPHTVGMSETAESLFHALRIDDGLAALEGVAVSATTRSNAPGNWMEMMSLDGRGDGDGQFGPPMGAFVLAVIHGLFGWSPAHPSTVATWRPAIPASWTNASLKLLSGTTLGIRGPITKREYSLALSNPQQVTFVLPAYNLSVTAVHDIATGTPLEFVTVQHPGGGYVHVNVSVSGSSKIVVLSSPMESFFAPPRTAHAGARVLWRWTGNFGDIAQSEARVRDPQRVFESFTVTPAGLMGVLTQESGEKTLFVRGVAFRVLVTERLESDKYGAVDMSTANMSTATESAAVHASPTVPRTARPIDIFASGSPTGSIRLYNKWLAGHHFYPNFTSVLKPAPDNKLHFEFPGTNAVFRISSQPAASLTSKGLLALGAGDKLALGVEDCGASGQASACVRFNHSDFWGDDLPTNNSVPSAQTWDQCCTACHERHECVSFSFHIYAHGGSCSLKNGATDLKPESTASGRCDAGCIPASGRAQTEVLYGHEIVAANIGGDVDSALISTVEECRSLCIAKQRDGCEAFTFYGESKQGRSSCQLKANWSPTASGAVRAAQSAISGSIKVACEAKQAIRGPTDLMCFGIGDWGSISPSPPSRAHSTVFSGLALSVSIGLSLQVSLQTHPSRWDVIPARVTRSGRSR